MARFSLRSVAPPIERAVDTSYAVSGALPKRIKTEARGGKELRREVRLVGSAG